MNATASTTDTDILRLRAHETLAAGTMAFHFDKPPGFAFRPGQAIELLLRDASGQETGHAFSLVSAPFEEQLVIATRMRDTPYKRALGALQPGAAVRFEGPFGAMTLHKKTQRAAVFIAGGIGITPFMSMLRQSVRDGMPQRIALIYSNRGRKDAAFIDELEAIARSNPGLRLVSTMTEEGGGLVDAAMISAAARDLPSPIFYVVGPPAMVEAMRETLATAGIDEDDIRSEDFYGY